MQRTRACDVVARGGRQAADVEAGLADFAETGVVGSQQEGPFVGIPFGLTREQFRMERSQIGDAHAPIQRRIEGLVKRQRMAEERFGNFDPGVFLDLHEPPFAFAADLEGIAARFDLNDGVDQTGRDQGSVESGRGDGGDGRRLRKTTGAQGGNAGWKSARERQEEPRRNAGKRVHDWRVKRYTAVGHMASEKTGDRGQNGLGLREPPMGGMLAALAKPVWQRSRMDISTACATAGLEPETNVEGQG